MAELPSSVYVVVGILVVTNLGTASALSATYAYVVGAGGSAGSGGVNGQSGGAGGSGSLTIEEFWQ